MNGISGSGKDRIHAIVEEMFDNLAFQLVGGLPKLQETKRLFISTERHFGLANLFVQAMANKTPNQIEKDVLRSLLESAHGHLEGLKNRTRAHVAERLDGLAREAKLRKEKLEVETIRAAIAEEMAKARSAMMTIVEAEATKLRNLGSMMDITRVASSISDEDPTVFFVVVKDDVTCKECIRLHLMADQMTPKLWKLSELKQGYHKRGENHPSAFGLHPHCRCTLTYLPKSYGFNAKGRLSFIDLGHDHFSTQRT